MKAASVVCRGDSAVTSPEPSSEYAQDGGGAGDGEWYLSETVTLTACQAKCTELADSWGCQYVSFQTGSTTGEGWCYVHQDCTNLDANSAYTTYYVAGAPTPPPTSPPPCEHHTGITGPEYPGLKLRNGELPSESACEYH